MVRQALSGGDYDKGRCLRMAVGANLCPALTGTHWLSRRIPLPTGDCRKPEACGAEATSDNVQAIKTSDKTSWGNKIRIQKTSATGTADAFWRSGDIELIYI